MMKKRKLVLANWKMNPQTPAEARKIFGSTKRAAEKLKNVEVGVCPPFVFLEGLAKIKRSKNLSLGVQNIWSESKGAFTGEISGEMAKNLGARFVLIGHSERRAIGETDEVINKKMHVALQVGLIPVLCIGERMRDKEASYLALIKNQLKVGLTNLAKKDLVGVIIAYEPVWAIGKSYRESMSPTDIHEMSLFIKKSLGEIFGRDIGDSAKILYGGSVERENASSIMQYGDVQGFLVGHASLVSEEFAEILKAADVKQP